MAKTNLTQPREIAAEDDSDAFIEMESLLLDSELLEDVEYTRMRRLSKEFVSIGGVRDF